MVFRHNPQVIIIIRTSPYSHSTIITSINTVAVQTWIFTTWMLSCIHISIDLMVYKGRQLIMSDMVLLQQTTGIHYQAHPSRPFVIHIKSMKVAAYTKKLTRAQRICG